MVIVLWFLYKNTCENNMLPLVLVNAPNTHGRRWLALEGLVAGPGWLVGRAGRAGRAGLAGFGGGPGWRTFLPKLLLEMLPLVPVSTPNTQKSLF